MSTRMWVLGILAWVGVVIAGSALTWLAINGAGEQVSDAADAEATQPVVLRTVNPAPTARPTRPRTGKPPPSPADPVTRTATAAPTPAPAPTRGPRPVAPSPRATV